MKRLFGSVLLVAVAIGTIALIAPPPQAQAAQDCVICPLIIIDCGPCANLIPQTCKQCAHCKQIPGCHT